MLFNIGFLKVSFIDVIDIALVSYIFYRIYEFIRGSMAARMLIGLLLILLLSVIAESSNMSGSSWIFSKLSEIWVIAFVIIFQPEFRRLLMYVGQNPILQKIIKVETPRFIGEVVNTVTDLSQRNYGSLIVLLRDTGIKSIIETGIPIQAQVSKPLLMSIFNPRSPLHDGGVVIQGSLLLAAKCQLPLTQNPRLDPTLGMRHRAALGLSEQTDAIVIVVSEETGMISVAENGVLTRGLSKDSLTKRIQDAFAIDSGKKKTFSSLLNWG